jgi:metal-dependent amidase/aminoacylase/carboxypeptidase family protein
VIPGLEGGKFYFHPGEMMSAVDNWKVEIIGKGGHGGIPAVTIYPVVAVRPPSWRSRASFRATSRRRTGQW